MDEFIRGVRMLIGMLVAGALLTSAARGQSGTPLFPGASFGVGSEPRSVAISDLNGDSRDDLAVANIASNSVSVLLGDGAGGFNSAPSVIVGINPAHVAISELNGDSIPDLVTANFGSNSVSVLLGDGAGGFGVASNVSVGINPHSVAISDMNSDGQPDLAVANVGSNSVSVLLGDGAGGFSAEPSIGVGSAPYTLAISDLNGDDQFDIAVANWNSNSVSVLLGDGLGGFSAAPHLTVGNNPHGLAISDLNSDGWPDIAVANNSSNTVSVLLGNGAGGFSPALSLSVGTSPRSLAISDLNGDGRSDLAVANVSSNSVSVLLGDGAGGFSAVPSVGVGSYPNSVAISDLDGDGRRDLAVANTYSNSISVLLGDGTGGFSAVLNVSAGSVPYFTAISDLNGDSRLDLVVANQGSNSVSVLLGDGAGGFSSAPSVSVGNPSYSVAISDLNGDGRRDLAVAANVDSNSVSVLLGDGAGGFSPALSVSVGSTPYSLAIDDLNGDNRPDMAVANAANTVSVLLADGFGGFSAAPSVGVGTYPRSVAISDLNGDSQADMAVVNHASHSVSVLLGNGAGGFSAAPNVNVGNHPLSVAIFDLNGDTQPDLAVANHGSNSVSVLLGDGAGGFSPLPSVGVGSSPYSVAISDLNGDSRPDMAVANYGSNSLSVLLGDGAGGFSAAPSVIVGNGPVSIAIADLNGDSRSDLAVANHSSNSVSVALNGLVGISSFYNHVLLGTKNLPMAGVLVEAVNPADRTDIKAWAITSADGSYSFANIDPGLWIVRASITQGLSTPICNYPEHRPMKTWSFAGGGLTTPIPPIVFPDPVVLQGGWAGSTATWSVALEYLQADPNSLADKRENWIPAFLCYPNYDYDNSGHDIGDHDTNARLLTEYIAGRSLQPWISPANRPDVVFSIMAHSMGGLITRAMLPSNQSTQPIVRRIVNFDSPHGGTALASTYILPAVVGGWQNLGGVPALTEENLNGTRQVSCGPETGGWNKDHVESPNSGRTWLLYEDTSPQWLNIVQPDHSAWGFGRPRISAWNSHLNGTVSGDPDTNCPIRPVHGYEVSVSNGHMAIHDNPTRLREAAIFLARGALPPPQPLPLQQAPTEGLGVLSGNLSAAGGGGALQQLRFDTNTIIYGRVVRSGAGAQYLLTDSSGTPLGLSNFVSQAISATQFLDAFEIAAPPTGTIDLALSAGSDDAQAGYVFHFDNGRKLLAIADPVTVTSGSTARLAAYLAESDGSVVLGTSGSFSAAIQQPGGSSILVTLHDDGANGDGGPGDGVFGALLGSPDTASPGHYEISLHGVQDLPGYAVERSGSTGFVVAATGAFFTGGVVESTIDHDQNDLIDTLLFDQPISLTENGTYKLIAELQDSLGATIAVLYATHENIQGAGAMTLRLSIPGPDLVRHGTGGQFRLVNRRLIRLDVGSLATDTAADYTTSSYAVSAFEWPPPPRVASLMPGSGPPEGGSVTTITGSSLLGTTQVLLGGRPAAFTVLDDHTLSVTIPRMPAGPPLGLSPHALQSPGKVSDLRRVNLSRVRLDLKVVTPWGYTTEVRAFGYTP